MFDQIDPRKRWALAVVAVAVLVLVVRAFDRGPAASASPPVSLASAAGAGAPGPSSTTAASGLTVDVDGAVRRPGVYVLAAGSRIEDALARAGGATHGAELAAVNRAAPLVDGEQVLVPSGAGAGAAPGAAGATGSGPVSINAASAAQLDALPGIGPATAAKIVADRAAHGPFHSVSDLQRVPGIGPAKLAALTGLVTL